MVFSDNAEEEVVSIFESDDDHEEASSQGSRDDDDSSSSWESHWEPLESFPTPPTSPPRILGLPRSASHGTDTKSLLRHRLNLTFFCNLDSLVEVEEEQAEVVEASAARPVSVVTVDVRVVSELFNIEETEEEDDQETLHEWDCWNTSKDWVVALDEPIHLFGIDSPLLHYLPRPTEQVEAVTRKRLPELPVMEAQALPVKTQSKWARLKPTTLFRRRARTL